MAYGGRFIDFVTNLTQKSTTIDGTEIIHLGSSGLSQKANTRDITSYTINNLAQTWNAGSTVFTGIKLNVTDTASAAASLLFDLQIAGSSKFKIDKLGNATANSVALTYLNNGNTNINIANTGTLSVTTSSASGQGTLQTFYTITTGNTATPLNITNTATDRMVIPATRSVTFNGIVQAMCNVSSSSVFVKSWEIKGTIVRDSNNTTRIVGNTNISIIAQDNDGVATPSTWAINTITADDTNESLAINVNGQANTTIRWQAVLIYSQVGF